MTSSALTRVCLPISWHTTNVWRASSRVGSRQMACVCARSGSTTLYIPSTYVAVLPVPLCPCAIRFRIPFSRHSTIGSAAAWIFDGRLNPFSYSPSSSSFDLFPCPRVCIIIITMCEPICAACCEKKTQSKQPMFLCKLLKGCGADVRCVVNLHLRVQLSQKVSCCSRHPCVCVWGVKSTNSLSNGEKNEEF